MSKRRDREGTVDVRRRIAATAATAALAVSGPAIAAPPASASRTKPPTRPSHARVAASHRGENGVAAARRTELAAHRKVLAEALAAELGAEKAPAIERSLSQIDAEIESAYARGERPDLRGGIQAALGSRIGVGENEVAEAFESMSRHAVERQLGADSFRA
jgi:hypothetical protein